MKRVLILLVSLLVSIPLALGAMAGLSYYTASPEHIPSPAITVMEQTVYASGYTWRTPVFGGLIFRDFEQELPQRIEDIGELTTPKLNMSLPEGYETIATVTRKGEVVWQGRATELASYEFLDNGRYRMKLECRRPMESDRGYGSILYQAAFSVSVQPRYEVSDDWVTQGDVLAIRLYNLSSSMRPVAEGDFGELQFVQGDVGQMTVYVPVSYNREPGSYAVYLSAGGNNWEIPVRVTDGGFKVRNYDVPEGENLATNGSDFAENYTDYQEKVSPLLSQANYTQLWDGAFLEPVKGEIQAEYGLYTYVNGSSDFTRHAGIDIGVEEGEEVIAPNTGRILLAEELEGTGNTIVIEHGGGLKSLLYHLDELEVKAGDTVEKGDIIGTVGNTGSTTKTHLHYEVRLGNSPLNPSVLFGGTSQLFYFK